MDIIIRELLQTIQDIRTPLIFWAFCALLVFIGFYVFSKRNKWFQNIVNHIIDRLTKANLYKITRLAIILLFIVIILTTILAFIAPIVNEYLDKQFGIVAEAKEEILKRIELREKYNRIIYLFENEKYEEAELLAMEVFGTNRISNNIDSLQGFVVAAHYGKGDYEAAAIEVAKRDKKKAKWDYSLTYDMALCIRSYAKKYSVTAATELVTKLKNTVSCKILSYMWCVIPINVVTNIFHGKHINRQKIDTTYYPETKFLIEKYPNDNFIEYGYLILGDYNKALIKKPKSLIRDVLLFERGFHYLNKLANTSDGLEEYVKNLKKNDSLKIYVNNSLNDFKTYVKEFPEGTLAALATFWIAWLEGSIGNYEECFSWLENIKNLKRKNSLNFQVGELKRNMIEILTIKEGLKFARLEKDEEERAELIGYACDKISFSKALREIQEESNQRTKALLYRYLVDREFNKGNMQGVSKVFEYFSEEEVNEDDQLKHMKEVSHLVQTTRYVGTITEYERAGSVLRRDYSEREIAVDVINEGIKLFSNLENVEKLLYLRIVAYRELEPELVDSLVHDMLIKYPNSDLADDVIAENAYVMLVVFDELKEGEKIVRRLLEEYPEANACDNALNWLAYAYRINCFYESEGIGDCWKAIGIYKEIKNRYANTRFAIYAKEYENLIQNEIRRIQLEN